MSLISDVLVEERTCENCVHERDSGHEFCGCCEGDPPSAWTECPYNLRDRAEAMLAEREAALSSIYRAWKAWREVRTIAAAAAAVTALDAAIEGSGVRDA